MRILASGNTRKTTRTKEMIEIVAAFAITGLIILWQFGIKPTLKNWNHEKDCEEYYRVNGNPKP